MGGTYVVDDDMGTARPRDQPGAHGEADNTSRNSDREGKGPGARPATY